MWKLINNILFYIWLSNFGSSNITLILKDSVFLHLYNKLITLKADCDAIEYILFRDFKIFIDSSFDLIVFC